MTKQPLADRLRPETMDDMVGQAHLFGKKGTLRLLAEQNRFPNMIFYGPPGTGKTTAAKILAKASGLPLYQLNATTASLSDVREVAGHTKTMFGANGVLLYLDEIQYFNKKQQQSLLEFLEDGRLTLIAATTENPGYAIYNALLSRSSVFAFLPVQPKECVPALKRGWVLLNLENGTNKTADEKYLLDFATFGGGDVRRSLGILENVYYMTEDTVTDEIRDASAPPFTGNFDPAGDVHYDLLSCLQKSIRGSDADAAVFYLAKLLAGGDLLSVVRRLQVIASEDVGMAYPLAPVIVRACTESAKELGLPEAAIPLANATVLLATSPKSNAAYSAYAAAMEDVKAGRGADIPVHLQSPLFKGYKYPHDFPGHYVVQQYLPDDVKDRQYLVFGTSKTEQLAKNYYETLKGMIHRS